MSKCDCVTSKVKEMEHIHGRAMELEGKTLAEEESSA